MRRASSAVLLFTLTPEAEGARKSLELGGSRRAQHVFAALIEHIETVCSGLSDADLLVASESGLDLPAGARGIHQRGGDFGECLRLAVEEAFALGYQRVLVIGNDAPEISRDYLETALDELSPSGRRAVVGPATDGGYNLLGLTEPCPTAFEAIPWSSSRVAELTVERLRESGFEVAHLRTLDDIDDAGALGRFLRRRRAGLERLVSRIRRLFEAVFWTDVESPGHHDPIATAGPPRLRAPPSLS